MSTAPTMSGPIEMLEGVCENHGLPDLAARLLGIRNWLAHDIAAVDRDLATLPRLATKVTASAHHLLDLGGKHLRPMCVALAARVGTGFDAGARQLAVAVELVHNATLLHDDVVDLGDSRRSAPTARFIYGNAASVFAGDWLLVAALRRIRAAAVPGTLDRMLAIIDEMIIAESLQLDNRGRIDVDLDDYGRIVEGKTAALFRWAMYAGGRAGNLDAGSCAALEAFGRNVGIAFQAVDDLLDYAGDSRVTGKEPFADLREGKVTYPLALALAGDAELTAMLEHDLAGDRGVTDSVIARVRTSLERSHALSRCRELAETHVTAAIACLDPLPDGAARAALTTLAEATLHRER